MYKLILIILISLIFYSFPFFLTDTVNSPDDLIYDFFSTHLAQTGSLSYRPPGDAVFQEEGFTPRYFVYNQQGKTLPRKFPGFILFWGAWKKLLPFPLSRLINPFCAVFALLFLFGIGRIILPEVKDSLRAVVLLASSPLFIHRSFAYNATLFNLTLFLAALYFLLRALVHRQGCNYLLFGLIGGFSLWVRPTNVIYLVSLFGLLLLERKRLRLNFLILALLLLVMVGGALLLYNYHFYGGFFSLGYTAGHQPAETDLNPRIPLSIRRIVDYLNFHPRIWLTHLKNFPLVFSLAFPLLIFSMVGFCLPPENTLYFRSFYLILLVLSVGFFANFATFGYAQGEFTVHSSFLRYLVPTISLLPLFAVGVVKKFPFPKQVMVIVTLFNLLIAIVVPNGMAETVFQSKYYQQCQRFLLENTPKDSVLFTYYWDKLVFPERTVYTHGTHEPNEKIGEVIAKIAEKGYPVYYPFNPCDESILKYLRENYRLEEVAGPPLSLLTRLAVKFVPPTLYPLRLYRVAGPLAPLSPKETETGKTIQPD